MIYVEQQEDKWKIKNWMCRVCSEVADSIAEIDHENECPVDNPDNVPRVVAESSRRDVEQIVAWITDMVQQGEYATDLTDQLKEKRGVKWVDSGSTGRVIAGLGKTSSRGDFHLQDQRPLVLKLEPAVRTGSITPTSGNIAELNVWEAASQRYIDQTETADRPPVRHTAFFADIVNAAMDGAWMLMEECLPVYPTHRSVMSDRDGIWDQDREYIDKICAAVRTAGYEHIDWKHGNIGLDQNGTPVFLDYGTGFNYEG